MALATERGSSCPLFLVFDFACLELRGLLDFGGVAAVRFHASQVRGAALPSGLGVGCSELALAARRSEESCLCCVLCVCNWSRSVLLLEEEQPLEFFSLLQEPETLLCWEEMEEKLRSKNEVHCEKDGSPKV